ncbi:hypothetical protein [Oricola sp.]|uniref:hypothetical protein n=1 Tax=Oricola sp. TaxID=1979950 RepID=UPI003BAA3BBE
MDYGSDEWFDLEIAQYRATLSRIVRTLCIKTGLDVGGADMQPECIWRAVLRVLYPAESATRRLLAVAARNIAVKLHVRRAKRRPFAGIAAAKAAAPAAADTETDAAADLDLTTVSEDAALDVPASVVACLIVRDKSPRPMTNIVYQGKQVPVGKTPWAPKPPKPARQTAPSLNPAFALFDPPIDYAAIFAPPRPRRKAVPRITFFGSDAPLPVDPPKPSPPVDGLGRTLINAAHVCRRVRALKAALDDLPGHAVRFARRKARLDSSLTSSQSQVGFASASGPGQRLAAYETDNRLKDANQPGIPPEPITKIQIPLRIGHPPGRRRRSEIPIDDILKECDALARYARARRGPGNGEELSAARTKSQRFGFSRDERPEP